MCYVCERGHTPLRQPAHPSRIPAGEKDERVRGCEGVRVNERMTMSQTHLLHSHRYCDITLRFHKQGRMNRGETRAKECDELVVYEVSRKVRVHRPFGVTSRGVDVRMRVCKQAHAYIRLKDRTGAYHSPWNNNRLAVETEVSVAVEDDSSRRTPKGQHLGFCVFHDKGDQGLVGLISALP